MKKKTSKLASRVICPLPLINPSTFLTAGAWQNTFEFILNTLQVKTRKKKFNHDIKVTFRDFYFMKVMEKEFDFHKLEKRMGKLGIVKSEVHEHHDRNDENDLRVTVNGLTFRIYEYHAAICCSMGEFVALDSNSTKRKEFQRDPVIWKTDMKTFVKFAEQIEQTFMQLGETWCARGFMTVKCDHATIHVGIFHERLPVDELHWKKGMKGRMLRYFDNIGVVPKPYCYIKFE